MMARVLRTCANAEQIFPPAPEEQSSIAPNPALPRMPGWGPSPEPQNFLGHCSWVPESTVPSCRDVALGGTGSAPRGCCAMPSSPAASCLCCEAESCSAEPQEETGR